MTAGGAPPQLSPAIGILRQQRCLLIPTGRRFVGEAAVGQPGRLGEVGVRLVSDIRLAQTSGTGVVVRQPLHLPFGAGWAAFQNLAESGVFSRPQRGRHQIQDRLPGEGVGEAQHPCLSRLGLEQTGGDRIIERCQRGVGRPHRRRHHGGDLDVLAHHRRELDGLALRCPERGQPAVDRVPHRGRRREAPRVHRAEAASGRQVPPHFAQQERVAPGLVAQHRGRPPGAGCRSARLTDEVVGDVLGGQAGQVEPAYAVQPVELGDRVHQRRRPVRGGGAMRREHQDASLRDAFDDVGEQLQRGGTRPVHVLERQHQGAALGGGTERGDGGVVELASVCALGLHTRTVAATPRPESAADRDRGHHRTAPRQRATPRWVRRRRCAAAAASTEQAGLAGTGFAADKDQLAGPLRHRRPDLVEHRQLRPAADKGGPTGTGPAGGQRGWPPVGHSPKLDRPAGRRRRQGQGHSAARRAAVDQGLAGARIARRSVGSPPPIPT